MADRQIDILLKLRSDIKELQQLETGVKGVVRNLQRGFSIGIGLDLFNSVQRIPQALINGAQAGVRFNATIEQNQIAFQTLLGSAEAAQERIASLVEFAARTPFELTELVEANRALEVMAGSAFASERGMRLVGDAAAVTNNRIEDVAFWVGRLVSGLQSGQPFGEASLRLQEMGLLAGDARAQLDRLTGQALSQARIFDILTDSFSRTEGGMEQLAQTFTGRISNIKDSFNILAGELSEGLFKELNATLQGLLELTGRVPTAVEEAARKVREIAEQYSSSAEQTLNPSRTFDDYDAAVDGFRSRFEEVSRILDQFDQRNSRARRIAIERAGFTLQQVTELKGEFKALGELGLVNLPPRGEIAARIDELRKLATVQEAYVDRRGNERSRTRTLSSTEQAELDFLVPFDPRTIGDRAQSNIAAKEATEEQVRANSLSSELLANEKKYQKEVEKTRESLRKNTTSIEDQIAAIDIRIRRLGDEADLNAKLLQAKEGVTDDDFNRLALQTEAELLGLVQERYELQSKLDKEKIKNAETEFNLRLRTEESVLGQLRYEREQASGTDRLDLIDREREQLESMIAVLRNRAALETDPTIAFAYNERANALKRELEELNRLNLTRIQQSDKRYSERGDPRSSFQNTKDAVDGALQDRTSDYGTQFDSIYDQIVDINNAFENGMADNIADLIDGTKGLDDAWKSFALTIRQQAVQALAEYTAKWIANQTRIFILGQAQKQADTAATVGQAATQTAALSVPALLQSIVSFGAAGVAGIAGLAAAFVGLPKLLGARKDGGPVSVGGTYLVGENGPELFTSPSNGYIVPNHDVGRGNGTPIQIAIYDDRQSYQDWLNSHEGENAFGAKLSQLKNSYFPS